MSEDTGQPLPAAPRFPRRLASVPARMKLYSARVTGPSTDMEEVHVHGLALDQVVTTLLMLDVGDVATIECTAETAAGEL